MNAEVAIIVWLAIFLAGGVGCALYMLLDCDW